MGDKSSNVGRGGVLESFEDEETKSDGNREW